MKENVDESLERLPVDRALRGRPPHGRRRRRWTEGRDVWWHEEIERRRADCPRRAVRRRAPAVPPLHLGHDRQAEGHPAHHRRLPDRRRGDPQAASSTSSRRPTSTGAPPTSAGSPATATSSTARSPTARRRSSTRARRTIPTRTAGGRSSSATACTIFYTAPTAIRACMKWGARVPGQARPVARCGCSAASASRSTRARGSGTAR